MGKKAKGDSTPARRRPESTDPGDARWWSLVLVAKRLMTRLEGDVALSVYREGLVCGQQYCMVRPIPTVRQPSPEPWRLMAPDEWAHREMSWSPAMPPEPDFVHVIDTKTCQYHSYSARFLAWGPYVGSLLLPTDSVAPIPTDSVGPSPVANPPPKPDTLQECAEVALRVIAADVRALGMQMPGILDVLENAVAKKCEAWRWTLMSRDTIRNAAIKLGYLKPQPRAPRKPK
jgi:hypothetical protein